MSNSPFPSHLLSELHAYPANADQYALEKFVEKHGLKTVLGWLAAIAARKSLQIQVAVPDRPELNPLAKQWERVGRLLAEVCEFCELAGPGSGCK